MNWLLLSESLALVSLLAGAAIVSLPSANVRGTLVVSGLATLGASLLDVELTAGPLPPPVLVAGQMGACAALLGLLAPSDELRGPPVRAWLLCALASAALGQAPAGWPVAILWVAATWAHGRAIPGTAARVAVPFLFASGVLGAASELVPNDTAAWLRLTAIALRLGVPPFQTWVVRAYERGPTTWVAGAVAPMAAFALVMRGAALPSAAVPWLAGAAAAAGLLTLVQKDAGRALGWMTAGIASITLAGRCESDPLGTTGAQLEWGGAGLGLLGFAGCVGLLRARVGALGLDRFHGFGRVAPELGVATLVLGLGVVGVPGTAAFAANDLELHGAAHGGVWSLVTMVVAISTNAYAALWMYARLYLGAGSPSSTDDLLPRERVAALVIAAILFAAGLAPDPLLHRIAAVPITNVASHP